MTQVAVVILNYNGQEFLKKFLPSVIQFSAEAKIVVADNTSTDNSVEFLKKSFPEVELIQIPSNRGFAGGYNYAFQQIKATYFILLNSDVEVTPGWIEPLIATLESDQKIGAVQPKILSFNDKSKFDYAGAAGGFIDTLGYPFCRGRLFSHVEKDTGQYNNETPIFWSSGACMMIRSSLYHEVNGLDEDFFAHMEEIDLCWKLHRHGYQVNYNGSSQVYHIGGGTLSATNPSKTYYNFRNGLSLIIKHIPTLSLVWKLPLRIILDWIAAFKFLIEGSPKHAWAVIRAHGYIAINYWKEMKKRRILKKSLPFTNGPMYNGFLILDFYGLRKREFSKLDI